MLFYFYVVPLLFSCSTIPWYSNCSASIRLYVPPVFRCSVVPCSDVPGFIVCHIYLCSYKTISLKFRILNPNNSRVICSWILKVHFEHSLLFLNVCKQTFHISHVRMSQKIKVVLKVAYMAIGNLAFFLFLYFTGVHFRSELQHVGDVSEQKIKC